MEAEKARRLKIGIVLDKFLPSRGGERYFSFLIEELTGRGHEVHVFATEIEEHGSAGQMHLVPVIKYPRSLKMLSFLVSSARVLRRYDLDVVHGLGQSLAVNVLNPHGGVEKAYLKQEFASITNWFYYVYKWLRRYLSPRHYLELWIQRRLYTGNGVKKIIAISRMVKRDIMDYYRVPEEKIVVVFNTVDLERFTPANREHYRGERRQVLGFDERTFLILFAGNNYRLKGLGPLLQAMGHLRQDFPEQHFCLLVAGRGRIPHYHNVALSLGVADMVSFLGPIRDMERYYAASDIYVHPTFYDSCSLTVLEALASGLPVITSRFNGASDVIASDEGGKIIDDPGNAEELAGAIAFYLDEGRRTVARSVARHWMEEYPPSRNVDETLAVYYEVAGKADQEKAG